ncbi:hypothetical protein NPIL_451 [Nephila pilipes]|uniref:Uncharacterized protein n=1 Tax=Nephila pilipes TaxID=299642 RepID=A0A8X6QQS8_NEPPI|nr:hypothetical protein NPIL_451 [Nephila pilipes]
MLGPQMPRDKQLMWMLRPIAAPSPSVNLEAIIAPPLHSAPRSPMGNLRSLPTYRVCSLVGYAFRGESTLLREYYSIANL